MVSPWGPITAHIVELSTGAHASAVVLQSVNDYVHPSLEFLGYAEKHLWFGETNGITKDVKKVVRIKAPGSG
jgi:hypothetical protein